MKHRIFVALPIARELQEKIFHWEKNFSGLPVRWLEGKNLHITLVPPWYEEDVEKMIAHLMECKGLIDSFSLSFTRVLYGPSPSEPRLIWAEGRAPVNLLTLKEAVEKAVGAEPEKRVFKLHLTLARFRPENFSSFPVKHIDEDVDWKQECNLFVLMESHLSRAGADYEILQTITF